MNKKIRNTVCWILLIFIAAWIFRSAYNKKEKQKEIKTTYLLSVKEKSLIQDGDIILRYGFGLASDYIVKTFDEKYAISHCGIISTQKPEYTVIHSESSSVFSEEGITEQNFDQFTDAGHLNSVIIVRYKQAGATEKTKISERSRYYLSKKIPFDYAFDIKDSSTMFCSEIIWHIFLDEFNHDIFWEPKKGTNINRFSNFWDTSQFEIILNHQHRM
ncbi:MAG: YiiX/YebB-like N1pC/P60 family cysteine hydrolase [Bacteroidota bacterium]|nr:YiiX/YebB-like N1pC/P60 family cysteine hydrolase [Bacteroidota bacterium]